MSVFQRGVFQHWPNRITAARFVGAIALFVLFAVHGDLDPGQIEGRRWPFAVAFWLFVVVACTDFVDGYLARRDNLVSAFGRIADPFTDKVLILGALVFLSSMPWSEPYVPASVVVAILAREFLVTGIRGYIESLGREFPADRFGKIKMIVQSVAVGALIWIEAYPWPDAWRAFWIGLAVTLVWVTLVATIGSGVGYVLRTAEILRAEGER